MLKKILLYAAGFFIAAVLIHAAAYYLYAVRWILFVVLLVSAGVVVAWRIIRSRKF